jgi:hypothetical protein
MTMSLLKGRTVTINKYARPCRVAFIVNTGNPEEEFAKVIEWSTFNVGGPCNSIFLQKSLRNDFFRELLYLHDPDFIMHLGSGEREIRKVLDRLSPFAKWTKKAFDGERSLAGVPLSEFMKEWESKSKVSLSATPTDQNLFLASAAVVGILSEDHRNALSRWFDFTNVDFQKRETELMKEQPFGGMLRQNMTSLPSGGRFLERCYAVNETTESTPFVSCIVVDNPDSLEAISLYWNLRATYHTEPYIFFLPKQLLESSRTEAEQFLWSCARTGTNGVIRILSSSLTPRHIGASVRGLFSVDTKCDQLSKTRFRVEKSGKQVILDLTSIHAGDLFEHAHRYYGEVESTPVTFDDNGGYLSCLHSKQEPSFSQAYHVIDFDIPFFKPTKSKTLQEQFGFGDSDRLSKTGVSVLLGGYAHQEDLLYLRLVDDLEGIGSIAADHGLAIRASDKGKMASQLLRMLGDFHELRFLSGSNVISFLRRYAMPMRQMPDYESALDYEGITRELRSQYSNHVFVDSFLQWLLRRKLLRTGIIVRCKKCYDRQFVPINMVRERISCQGCRSFLEMPLDGFRHLRLYYVPNSLLVNSVRQGFLPHLLALYLLATHDESRSYGNLTFFYPGVEIIKRSKVVGELDFVLVFDNEIITGECKQTSELTADDVTKTVTLSKSIGADVVSFCTTERFPLQIARKIEKSSRKKGVKSVVFDQRDLTNQSTWRWMWRERARRGEKAIEPDQKLFCEDVIRASGGE